MIIIPFLKEVVKGASLFHGGFYPRLWGDKRKKQRKKAVDIPAKVAGCVGLSGEEGLQLYKILYKILGAEDKK